LARDTVGGKPHWTREVGGVTYHLYAISVPHDGFAIGTDLRSHILECETYEDRPGWGTSTWKEECAANGGAQQVGGHPQPHSMAKTVRAFVAHTTLQCAAVGRALGLRPLPGPSVCTRDLHAWSARALTRPPAGPAAHPGAGLHGQ
jgi:hypothetical protein